MIPPMEKIMEEILEEGSSKTLREWLRVHGYEICGDEMYSDNYGIYYTAITSTAKWVFSIDNGWGISLSRTNNPGYETKEIYYIKDDGILRYNVRLPNGSMREVTD